MGRIAPQSCAAALRPGSETTARRPGCCITKQCQQQQQTRTFFSKERSKSVYEYGAHRSDAEAKIAEVPVVMVDGPVALCDGGEEGRDGGMRGGYGATCGASVAVKNVTWYPPVHFLLHGSDDTL